MISDRFEVSGKNIDLGNNESSVKSISSKVQHNFMEKQGSFGGEFIRPRTPKITNSTDEAQIKSEFNFLKL